MASKRDKLKMLNQVSSPKVEETKTTIVDELVEKFEQTETEEKSIASDIPESVEDNKLIHSTYPTELVNVIDKSNVGRPKILQGVYKPISARLKMENYEYARLVGGKYGGMNGYINWLIEEDRKKSNRE